MDPRGWMLPHDASPVVKITHPFDFRSTLYDVAACVSTRSPTLLVPISLPIPSANYPPRPSPIRHAHRPPELVVQPASQPSYSHSPCLPRTALTFSRVSATLARCPARSAPIALIVCRRPAGRERTSLALHSLSSPAASRLLWPPHPRPAQCMRPPSTRGLALNAKRTGRYDSRFMHLPRIQL